MAGSDSDNRSTEGDSGGSAEKMWKGPVLFVRARPLFVSISYQKSVQNLIDSFNPFVLVLCTMAVGPRQISLVTGTESIDEGDGGESEYEQSRRKC